MKTEAKLNTTSLTGEGVEGYLTERPDYTPPGYGVELQTIKGKQAPSIKTGDFTEGSLNFTVATKYETAEQRDEHRRKVAHITSQPTFTVTFSGSQTSYLCCSGGLTINEKDPGGGVLLDVLDFSLKVVSTVKK